MLEPTRIISTEKPPVIYNLNSGYWYYNYDIREEVEETETSSERTDNSDERVYADDVLIQTKYSYVQMRMYGKPEYKKCVGAVIREYLSEAQEFDLINSANKDILAGKKTSDNIEAYKEYLDLLDEIKQKVLTDLGK